MFSATVLLISGLSVARLRGASSSLHMPEPVMASLHLLLSDIGPSNLRGSCTPLSLTARRVEENEEPPQSVSKPAKSPQAPRTPGSKDAPQPQKGNAFAELEVDDDEADDAEPESTQPAELASQHAEKPEQHQPQQHQQQPAEQAAEPAAAEPDKAPSPQQEKVQTMAEKLRAMQLAQEQEEQVPNGQHA